MDRPGSSRGGGVLLLCWEDVKFKPLADLCRWPESGWLEIHQSCTSRPLLIGCYYRPPTSSTADVEDFISSLELTFGDLDLSSSDVVLVGDFNAISSTWCSSDRTNLPGRLLEPIFLSLGLQQCVSSPTHLNANGTLGSLLDLVLISGQQLQPAIETLPPIANSDHLPVLCRLRTTLSSAASTAPRQVWCYDEADFKALNSALTKSDWTSVSTTDDIDSAWSSWLSVFLASVSNFVPSKVVQESYRG